MTSFKDAVRYAAWFACIAYALARHGITTEA